MILISGNVCSVHIEYNMKKLSKCLLWVVCSAASTVRPITVMLTTPGYAFLLNLINMKQLSSVRHYSLNSKEK